jgi:3,4-dihydroxy 2-butanone 4-phosphate synthase/GTP cyclohydrolase II
MNTIEEALQDFKDGKMVIVVDDEDRENEGDVVCASELCTPDMMNFMVSKCKGLVCVAITETRAAQLNLYHMVRDSSALHGTNFTVSVDYIHGTTTGISTYDRTATVRSLVDPKTKPEDLGRPGHIFPLIAVKEGVLRRAGHTEATVDMMRLAGLSPSGVLCEVMNEDGTMARKPDLERFAEEYGMKMVSVKDLIAYRLRTESLVRNVASANMPTRNGDFKIRVFENMADGKDHVALVKGEWTENDTVLVRVHSECLTGDVFGSLRCDCGSQLDAALKMIDKEGRGVLLYMRQEGRGIGLVNKVKAYKLQEEGLDTVEANLELGFQADPRDYGIGAQILSLLGVRKMKLITNNPQKRAGIEGYGLSVVEMVPIEVEPNDINKNYLLTKKNKLGHLLHNLDE